MLVKMDSDSKQKRKVKVCAHKLNAAFLFKITKKENNKTEKRED